MRTERWGPACCSLVLLLSIIMRNRRFAALQQHGLRAAVTRPPVPHSKCVAHHGAQSKTTNTWTHVNKNGTQLTLGEHSLSLAWINGLD